MTSSIRAISAMLIVIIAYVSYQLWKERSEYPVLLLHCAKFDGKCRITAKFDDLASCQFHAEMGDMGCQKDEITGIQTCRPQTTFGQSHCEVDR